MDVSWDVERWLLFWHFTVWCSPENTDYKSKPHLLEERIVHIVYVCIYIKYVQCILMYMACNRKSTKACWVSLTSIKLVQKAPAFTHPLSQTAGVIQCKTLCKDKGIWTLGLYCWYIYSMIGCIHGMLAGSGYLIRKYIEMHVSLVFWLLTFGNQFVWVCLFTLTTFALLTNCLVIV